MLTVKGRVAFITGGVQGIGYHSAEMMCKNGMKVGIVDINEEKVVETVKKLNALGGAEAMGLACDVSDVEAIENAIKTVAEHFGQLDVIVNSAGVLSSTKFEDMEKPEMDRVLGVNLTGTFFVMQKALPYLKKSKNGRVINISSVAGRMGSLESSMSYVASKGGVCSITKGLARKFAPYSVTCNAVCPGPVMTELFNGFSDDAIKNLESNILLKRLGKPEEVAAAVCFLASEEAAFMTGTMIDVNGGLWIA